MTPETLGPEPIKATTGIEPVEHSGRSRQDKSCVFAGEYDMGLVAAYHAWTWLIWLDGKEAA